MDKEERDADIRQSDETFARQEGKTEKLSESEATEEQIPEPLDGPWSSEDTRLLLRWLVVVAVAVLAVGALIVAF